MGLLAVLHNTLMFHSAFCIYQCHRYDKVLSMMPDEPDALDARILLALDDDPDATVLGLARSLGVARNTVHARLQRMAAPGGPVRSYTRRIDPAGLGYPLTAFVLVALSQSDGPTVIDRLRELPEVVQIHCTTGEADLLVTVVARDTADLLRVTTAMLGVPGVTRTSTTMSLIEAMPLRTRPLLERIAAGDR